MKRTTQQNRKRPERIAMIVQKGGLSPADGLSQSKLRSRNYHIGDQVFIEVKKPRNPKFHRKAHAFGELVAENIDSFHGYDSHRALKRLQMESGVGCEEMGYMLPGHGMVTVRVPQSLSFESMEQGEFEELYKAMCQTVSDRYWPELDEEQIESMAECMINEGAA